MNALGPSLAPYVRSSRSLKGLVTPIAHWYADLMGYRRMGLKYDDLRTYSYYDSEHTCSLLAIHKTELEELPEVQRALGRLTPREAYDRAYRMKVSLHQSAIHKDLPKDTWVTAKDDVRYLKPHIEAVIKEDEERAAWDNMTINRK
ncbi:cytochrome b-c1 complex subunit 7 [Chiua virens]|nr:cytochrome b-c1 complex subunit 7 [Chiua virens]